MQKKCDYCGNFYEDTLEACPGCNAPNEKVNAAHDKKPATIEELKAWYAARNLPPYEVTRFFIGIDYKEKRAFGIYEENGEFIVYKNKDDGKRAIRYQGKDEAYAVNELYLKLKEEILNQKSHQGSKSSGLSSKKKTSKDPLFNFFVGIGIALFFSFIFSNAIKGAFGKAYTLANVITLFVVAALCFGLSYLSKKWVKHIKVKKILSIILIVFLACVTLLTSCTVLYDKYKPYTYRYDDNVYVYYKGDYYIYDSYYGYTETSYDSLPAEFVENRDAYTFDWTDDNWYDSYDFEDSDIYQSDYTYSSSDSDSDYDWSSSDSWDSGSTDWGSDW